MNGCNWVCTLKNDSLLFKETILENPLRVPVIDI